MSRKMGKYQALSTGREFGITAVRGIRAFAVDDEGALVGTTGHVYESGENVARCNLDFSIGSALHGGFPGLATNLVNRIPELFGREHDMKKCSCGFYAYHDGVSDFPLHENTPYSGARIVHGVIEGYGKATIGKRGFRAEKMRLLAVAIPSPPPEPESSATPKILSWSQFATAFGLGLLMTLFMYWAALGFEGIVPDVVIDASAVGFGLCIMVGLLTHFRNNNVWKTYADRIDSMLSGEFLDPALVALVRQRYPEVAILPSVEIMLAEFPPDVAPVGDVGRGSVPA